MDFKTEDSEGRPYCPTVSDYFMAVKRIRDLERQMCYLQNQIKSQRRAGWLNASIIIRRVLIDMNCSNCGKELSCDCGGFNTVTDVKDLKIASLEKELELYRVKEKEWLNTYSSLRSQLMVMEVRLVKRGLDKSDYEMVR